MVVAVATLGLWLASYAAAAPASAGAFDEAACDVSYTFDVRNWVVDYLRPTAPPRKTPFEIPDDKKKAALLINNQYPGPLVEATEGDLVCVTVHNNLLDDQISIHMHGQHFRGFPAFDGVYGVTQSGIPPQGGTMTYRWIANAGSHYYHAHMQAQEADKGLKGPVLIHAKENKYEHMYDEDMVVSLSDDWRDPEVCLRDEGAQPGNPVCAEIEKATFNGVWGDGSKDYPYPKLVVETGKCYRMRFIGMMGQTQNFEITMAGHNMTLIAYDGADVEPVQVRKFNLHSGERADVVVCADQVPGNYLVEAVYDLATFLETAPSPKMPKVDSSKFFAFLNYKGFTEEPPSPVHKVLGGYKEPPGTGGGAYPGNVTGIEWNLNKRSSWGMVRNTEPLRVAADSDEDIKRITLNIGIKTPPYTVGTPYATADRIYLFDKPIPWSKPATPLLHTKGTCGADNVPFITLNKDQTVEVVINNLTPTAHVLHAHGGYFEVVNYAPFSETWCSESHVECFFTTVELARLRECPGAQLGDPNGTQYDWGCPYEPGKDNVTAFPAPLLKKDMISIWRRSWAVIRFRADNPGTWLFHCHAEQHIPMGQVMAFNVLPQLQPPVPKDVPTEGPCPVVNPE